MTYGLQVTNDASAVSLDSEYARLCVFHKSSYTAGVAIVFSSVVDTQEPPLIFLRPQNNGSVIQLGVLLNGSPGAWTGCSVVSAQNHSGLVFVGAFSSKPTASYGLRMWGPNGVQIFDSGMQAAVFTRVVQNWTYTNSTQDALGYVTHWYSIPLNYSSGDYLMVNNARMPMMSGENTSRTTGLRYDFAASVLRFSVTGLFNPNYLLLPAVFGKISA